MDKEEQKVRWYLKPVSVIFLLFFVLGPLALPLLYKSPKFNKTSKVLLTIVVVIYTLYLILASLKLGELCYTLLNQ